MGVKIHMVKSDLRAMKHSRDSELKQAYTDKKKRALVSKRALVNVRDERFKLMTGMTFQEKNFDNMVNYYRPELTKIIGSKDENAGIMRLPKNVQRALTRNEIIIGHRKWRQISSKACDQLQLSRKRNGLNKNRVVKK